MDAANPLSAACNWRRRLAESPQASRRSIARTSYWPDASQCPGVAFTDVTNCLIRESVEISSHDILLELSIPRHRVKFEKPITEFHHLLRRKLPNRGLNFVDRAHTVDLSRSRRAHKPKIFNPSKATG